MLWAISTSYVYLIIQDKKKKTNFLLKLLIKCLWPALNFLKCWLEACVTFIGKPKQAHAFIILVMVPHEGNNVRLVYGN